MSSDDERKRSEEEETSEEEEEETSEEESEDESEESSDRTSSSSNKAPSATASPRSPREDQSKSPRTSDEGGKKKNAKEEKSKKKKKTKKNDEQSVLVIDGRTVLKKTYELTKDKHIEFTVSIENRPYKPEEKVELKFEIKNTSGKTMKSIKCVLETTGAKPEGDVKKKAKKPKKGEVPRGTPTGTEDEFYCGARFPLEKYSDFKGSDGYRLPKKAEKTSGQVKHELHLSFPIRSRPINSWKDIDVWLPIEIGN